MLLFETVRRCLLLGTVGLCTISSLPAFADAPSPAAPLVQIRCTAVRARVQDVDNLGINFNLMPSERPSDNSLAKTSNLPPRFAAFTSGPDADRMLRRLTQRPGSVVQTFLLKSADGQPGTFSLARLSDPGISAGSQLSVTPQCRTSGAVTLHITPHFNFVLVPGPGNPAAPVSVAGFFLRPTLPNGGLLAFTLFPKSKPGMHFGESLPLIPAPGSGRHEDSNETQLWIFLSATLLPDERGSK